MYYIIASHGKYAEECKKSCEMIVGEAPTFKVVTFTAEMTKDDVEQMYKNLLTENKSEECAGIITDIPGGTPYNATAAIKIEYPKIPVASGLCMGMLIALATGDSLADAIVQAKETIISENVKRESKKVSSSPRKAAENNGIVNLRLDERLIHGQVATFWTRTLQATRLMVVGDKIVQDEVGKEALKAAVPTGIKLSVLSTENAAKRLNGGLYAGQRVFLIVNEPKTIAQLIDAGVRIKEVNIGNMGKKDGRIEVKKSVYCTDEERQMILDIDRKVPVFAQMVPNDEKKRFASFLK